MSDMMKVNCFFELGLIFPQFSEIQKMILTAPKLSCKPRKQTFPEKRDSQKRDHHFRMEVVLALQVKMGG